MIFIKTRTYCPCWTFVMLYSTTNPLLSLSPACLLSGVTDRTTMTVKSYGLSYKPGGTGTHPSPVSLSYPINDNTQLHGEAGGARHGHCGGAAAEIPNGHTPLYWRIYPCREPVISLLLGGNIKSRCDRVVK